GLGKTVQIAAFISGLNLTEPNKLFLILCPATIIEQVLRSILKWSVELKKWCNNCKIMLFHSTICENEISTKSKIEKMENGIVVSSYGMFLVNNKFFRFRKKNFDYLILDEGHKIRNVDAKITKSVKKIKTSHRLILSGAPVQNNLKEL
ncbi:DNA excision repair protein ERCC-6, partial [Bonamia ostreae]